MNPIPTNPTNSPSASTDVENPPAFPQPLTRYDGDEGMRLRDWFAGQALAGMTAQADERRWHGQSDDIQGIRSWRSELARSDADYCYILADAMLRARKEVR